MINLRDMTPAQMHQRFKDGVKNFQAPPPSPLGVIEPDITGILLGTGYFKFRSPVGISGLAKVEGSRCHILALLSNTPHHGQFREFIRLLKAHYDVISVWQVLNHFLPKVLERYGFTPDVRKEDDETVPGFTWRR